ncbi:MAG: GlxA family transcriptional regulator [Marinovum algicola]|uniref:Transcriptional regulator GlxA family, contains an amidase domain and an AraC-type DNA-binding HTH domain n=1 Tax=Marinovum algicola TaxID=42444 RepID=A0A975W6U8_9RHOB|nr:GlxA family transcriptional regulator [Marinovum algicola]SEI65270.1 Transcriptional regulator GlxA family, contains an amidase domain and an AraC-type DNA-binding HTH domain [Marinovum algicola]SLN24440.1 HTH-type transcriptional regulator CdhR [Marinovum algicola]
MTRGESTTTLGFLIFPGFPMSCLTSAIEPLRAANEISGQAAFDWKLIGETGARVESSAHIWFDPDRALTDDLELDYLFLLSGPLARFETPRPSNGRLRSLSRHGVRVGGVSGGVFPLARSGLLAGHRCSVHWCYAAAFAAEFPDHPVEDDVIIIDRDRLTVSGAAAVFDLMLGLIDARLGEEVTTEVACWFQHPLMRGQGVRQKVPTLRRESTSDMLPPSVAEAIRIFGDHIEDPVNVDDVAQLVGLSPRQLERNFKTATGQSPSRYYRNLRMNAARQLVLYSNDSMARIAAAVGYGATAPLVRQYRRAFGATPQQDRQKINLFRVERNRPIPS